MEIGLVKHRSHENFTFHIPVGPDFNRKDVLPYDQLKALKDMAAKIKMRQRMLDMIYNQKLYICRDIVVDYIVKRAADDLFNTPKVS